MVRLILMILLSSSVHHHIDTKIVMITLLRITVVISSCLKHLFPSLIVNHLRYGKDKCEKYFRMFNVPDDFKASYFFLEYA